MDKLERLLNLTAALLNTGRPLSRGDIHERVPGYPEGVDSFRRAFERDKDDLREMGIPLKVEPIADSSPPVDGYRIPAEDYYLNDPGLMPDELAALHLAASMFRLEGSGPERALWKLGGGAPEVADETRPLAALPSDDNLAPLWQAVKSLQSVSFTYKDEVRTVDPLRLDFRRGRWYLTGWDHDRSAERNFRLDRFQSEVALGERSSASPPPAVERPFEPWRFGDEPEVQARVRIDADRALSTVSRFDPEALEWCDDGSVILNMAVTNRDAFRSFVLSFLEHGEILDPPELRQDLIDWLEAIADSGPGASHG